jgi:hypothetical protein
MEGVPLAAAPPHGCSPLVLCRTTGSWCAGHGPRGTCRAVGKGNWDQTRIFWREIMALTFGRTRPSSTKPPMPNERVCTTLAPEVSSVPLSFRRVALPTADLLSCPCPQPAWVAAAEARVRDPLNQSAKHSYTQTCSRGTIPLMLRGFRKKLTVRISCTLI